MKAMHFKGKRKYVANLKKISIKSNKIPKIKKIPTRTSQILKAAIQKAAIQKAAIRSAP